MSPEGFGGASDFYPRSDGLLRTAEIAFTMLIFGDDTGLPKRDESIRIQYPRAPVLEPRVVIFYAMQMATLISFGVTLVAD